MRLRHPQRLLTVGGDVGREPLTGQATPDEARHPQVVLDDQDTHAFILSAKDER